VNHNFITVTNHPCGVAVDASHVYWAHSPGTASGIGRANLDGSNVEEAWIPVPLGNPCGVAVNATHVYWGQGTAAIGRADINGANIDQSFIGGLSSYACGGAITDQYIFWGHGSGTENVGRANINGSGVNDAFITGNNKPCGVGVQYTAAPGPPGPPPANPPSNQFSFGKLKRDKKKGTAKLAVDLPGPGALELEGGGVKSQRPAVRRTPAAKPVGNAGTVQLKIKPTGKTKKKLKRKGKAKVSVDVTFTPTGGTAATQSKKLKLKRKRKR
jgi:hypothetical protein